MNLLRKDDEMKIYITQKFACKHDLKNVFQQTRDVELIDQTTCNKTNKINKQI